MRDANFDQLPIGQFSIMSNLHFAFCHSAICILLFFSPVADDRRLPFPSRASRSGQNSSAADAKWQLLRRR